MSEFVRVEMPIEKYQGLLSANLLQGCTVVKVIVPFERDDKYNELTKQINKLYKERDEHEFELKKQQGLIYEK